VIKVVAKKLASQEARHRRFFSGCEFGRDTPNYFLRAFFRLFRTFKGLISYEKRLLSLFLLFIPD
jgi:hypothetical protein